MPDHHRPALFCRTARHDGLGTRCRRGLPTHFGPSANAIWGKPKAFVVCRRTATMAPVVLGASRHETIHDFGGFPRPLYRVRYDTAGEPEVAHRVADLMAGLPGVPLAGPRWSGPRHLDFVGCTCPAGDVPVVPLSLTPHASRNG